jgi:hypothetical protein
MTDRECLIATFTAICGLAERLSELSKPLALAFEQTAFNSLKNF